MPNQSLDRSCTGRRTSPPFPDNRNTLWLVVRPARYLDPHTHYNGRSQRFLPEHDKHRSKPPESITPSWDTIIVLVTMRGSPSRKSRPTQLWGRWSTRRTLVTAECQAGPVAIVHRDVLGELPAPADQRNFVCLGGASPNHGIHGSYAGNRLTGPRFETGMKIADKLLATRQDGITDTIYLTTCRQPDMLTDTMGWGGTVRLESRSRRRNTAKNETRVAVIETTPSLFGLPPELGPALLPILRLP